MVDMYMNKRRTLSKCMAMGGLLPFIRGIDRKKPSLKILAFHRIKNIVDEDYLFDEHLVDASIEAFDQQMAFLSKHYKVLPLTEAYDEFSRTGEPDIIAVTFDDGFDDLYFNAFPILQKYDIRPTMFLTTGLIGTNNTLWSEQIVYAVKSSVGKEINLPFISKDLVTITKHNSAEIISKLLRQFKTVSNLERLEISKNVFEQLDIKLEKIESSESRMLTWDMVREMADWGVEFGSHTVNHPVLSRLSAPEIDKEIAVSKDQLETELSKPCLSIAYPVGATFAYSEKVLEIVKKYNYTVACSYVSGVNYSNSLKQFELRRLHIDKTVDLSWFKGIVTVPYLCASDFRKDS